ncbi:uncharacterized protein F4812DRAFT_60811 [Daldinia caldariorum]|uniref:uncharacterized protein n=1 Tax=Daldinia caldariorum TaxID=326644 RepID=UPI0020083AE7|nr:uncharacterized protein F4812DRAFT_60811 [Daldinia caldariorum]KAI1466651.1 hypothetical protein F4812DRAFT_60811 [Daldinia caldariorum]
MASCATGALLLPFAQPLHPTLRDAEEVRAILERKVPPELAVQIVSLGYSPWVAKRRADECIFYPDYSSPDENHCVAVLHLASERVPDDDGDDGNDDNGRRRVVPRRVIFQTSAAYGGWVSDRSSYFAKEEDAFRNSHARFDASILRPLSPSPSSSSSSSSSRGAERQGTGQDMLPPLEIAVSDCWWEPRAAADALREKGWEFVEAEDGRIEWRVCNNSEAHREWQDYKVEWTRGLRADSKDDDRVGKGAGFVELLKPGYIVVLWARTGLRSWCSKVRAATIEIEYELP